MQKHFIAQIIFCIYLFSSCSEDNRDLISEKPLPVGEPIVGKPIITEEANLSAIQQSVLEPDSKGEEINNSKISNERIIEEGLVVNGVPMPNDLNETIAIIPSRLPPMEENSEYELIPFRDFTSFVYEVNWELDGQDFDFSAYSQRVPKEVRQKNGLSVAIEGFMIPTIVDENNMVKEFLLLPDQMSCCFGQSPEANGWVVVTAPNGVDVLMDEVIRATGSLSVEERWDEEFFVGLYHLVCDEVTGPSL
jgi:hypothetical protein